VSSAEASEGVNAARKARRLHALGVVLAVISLCIQAFVVQPHVDGLAFGRASPYALAAHVKAPPEAPGVCVFCQEAALAGALTLAATPALALFERTGFNQTAPLRQRLVSPTPSHNWQSRAPPHFV